MATLSLPPGSVLEFPCAGIDGSLAEATLGLLVTSCEVEAEGVWLGVNVLGATSDEMKKAMQTFFKGNKRMVHLCQVGREHTCPLEGEEGLHVRRFRWHPPGDFKANWLSNYAAKRVKEGPKMAAAANADKAAPSERPGQGGEEVPPLSDTEKRLSALRGQDRRVSFGDMEAPRFTSSR